MDSLRYLELFVSESRERLATAFDLLERLASTPGEIELHRELMRQAHSLKGMAATMGYTQMVDIAHAVEELFDACATRHFDDEAIELLEHSLNCLDRMVDRAAERRPALDSRSEPLAARLREICGSHAGANVESRRALAEEQDPSLPLTVDRRRFRIAVALSDAASRSSRPTVSLLQRIAGLGRISHVSPVRVGARHGRFDGRLDLLLESGIHPDALEAALRSMRDVDAFEIVEETSDEVTPAPGRDDHAWVRVRADLLDGVMDQALELMFEHGRARTAIDQRAGGLSHQLDRAEFLLRRLYGTLVELRLMPFDTVSRRIHGCIDPMAQELSKKVRLAIRGGNVRLDRSLLDALVVPLQHIVRNAVDHGVESADERRAAGKPATATIELTLERRGGEVHVTLRDDGRGLDPAELRRVAVARGLVDERVAADLDDAAALQLITRPGFTTRDKASSISGRGVGMDVVRAEVERLGGRVRVASRHGWETTIELRLPVDTALIQALLVRCAGELFAVPMTALARTVALDDTADADGERRRPAPPALDDLRLSPLAERLGLPGEPSAARSGTVLVLRSAEPRGLLVDEIVGRREIVVRTLHEPLASLRQYSGAALMDDGSVALVLDPQRLAF